MFMLAVAQHNETFNGIRQKQDISC
jgi:hypothetical protein